ncbi:hypothetical protein CXB65_11810 [Pseudomonas monteilii]|uniref:Uncharacterized protein n=1 Tax=Pseudomonas monteilii TaxID=76759 RepID=A0A2N1ISL5_9PSED|nr:hypothetical protein CXB65_11810 [Pseudomonas monteilii]RPD92918.1 hypothetical protein EGN69_24560 [Pseudomonas monteilii]
MQVGVLSLWAKNSGPARIAVGHAVKQATRWRAPASPVIAGKPAPTENGATAGRGVYPPGQRRLPQFEPEH